ncbi:MAG: sensor histidine kinase [Spirosomataceae bacterium]|jgi:two-component sensor histidine kinase
MAVSQVSHGQKTYEQKLAEANELIADGQKNNNKDDLAEGYFRRGKIADGLGNYKEASTWFQKARLLYLEKKPSFELARVLMRLSAVEFQQKHFLEALRINEEAVLVAEEINDDKAKFLAYGGRANGLAEISLRQGDTLNSFNRILKDFQIAEKYAKKIGDKNGLNEMYLNFGGVFLSYKKPELSLKLYEKIIPEYEKKTFDQPKIIFFLNLAFTYLELNKPDETIKILKKIEPIVQKPDYKEFNVKIRFHEVAAAYQEAIGNYQNANKHYRILKTLLEEAVNQDNEGQITKLNRQFDIKAKDKEISERKKALETEKKLRVTQNWLLILSVIFLLASVWFIFYIYKIYKRQKQLSERNAMLVHEQNHRVKNNLQVISSMLNIQANMSEEKAIIDTIQEIKLRIDSMIQLQKQLYANDLTGLINLKILIKELIQSAAYNFGIANLKSEIEFEKEYYDMDLTMTLALIINELITNACKYAFVDQKNPQLSVSLKNQERNLEIFVLDNGLHAIQNTKLITENSSFGFKMINMLLIQIDGKLSYSYENGSKFTITLKTNGKN